MNGRAFNVNSFAEGWGSSPSMISKLSAVLVKWQEFAL